MPHLKPLWISELHTDRRNTIVQKYEIQKYKQTLSQEYWENEKEVNTELKKVRMGNSLCLQKDKNENRKQTCVE